MVVVPNSYLFTPNNFPEDVYHTAIHINYLCCKSNKLNYRAMIWKWMLSWVSWIQKIWITVFFSNRDHIPVRQRTCPSEHVTTHRDMFPYNLVINYVTAVLILLKYVVWQGAISLTEEFLNAVQYQEYTILGNSTSTHVIVTNRVEV